MGDESKATDAVAPPTDRREVAQLPRSLPEDRDTIRAVLGNIVRSGEWVPPEYIEASANLGNIRLDFRQARLPPGVTDLYVRAVLGEIEIIVPPHVEVDLSASTFMGNMNHRVSGRPWHERLLAWWQGDTSETEALAALRRASMASGDGSPTEATVLSIRGVAILGNIVIRRMP